MGQHFPMLNGVAFRSIALPPLTSNGAFVAVRRGVAGAVVAGMVVAGVVFPGAARGRGDFWLRRP